MDRYIEFNCHKFLKDSQHWDAEIEALESQIDSITEVQSPSTTPGRSGQVSDPVGDTAAKLIALKAQLQRLQTYKTALSFALDCLQKRQKEVIDLFYFGQGYISHNIDRYAAENGICRSYVYREKRDAINEIARIINEMYCE